MAKTPKGEVNKDQLEQNLAKLWESIFILKEKDNAFVVKLRNTLISSVQR